MAFELKSEILSQISKTQDENLRIVLLLLLGVLEAGAEGMQAIADKIDDLRNDEDALRKAVLNGIAHTHEDDHHWLTQHRVEVGEYDALMLRAMPLIDWVEQRVKEEEAAQATRTSLLHKLLEAAASQIGVIAVTALVTWLGFMKIHGGL